jgi:hypothetical protein
MDTNETEARQELIQMADWVLEELENGTLPVEEVIDDFEARLAGFGERHSLEGDQDRALSPL